MRVPVWLVRVLGVLIWLSAWTVGLWAPHKPLAVVFTASVALAAVGIALGTWRVR